jgi:hypothetical protein
MKSSSLSGRFDLLDDGLNIFSTEQARQMSRRHDLEKETACELKRPVLKIIAVLLVLICMISNSYVTLCQRFFKDSWFYRTDAPEEIPRSSPLSRQP